MKSLSKGKIKPLSALRDKSKGGVHHIEIHPAKNSEGGLGFITNVHRHPPPATQANPYPAPPPADETVHEDGQDMLDHVGRQLGVPQEPDEDDQPDQAPPKGKAA